MRTGNPLRINPDSRRALESSGIAYAYLNRFEEAARTLQQAIRIYPDAAYTHAWLAQVYGALGEREAAFAELRILEKIDAAMAKETEPHLQEKLENPPPAQ